MASLRGIPPCLTTQDKSLKTWNSNPVTSENGYEGPEHHHMNDSRKPLLPKPLFQENLLVNQLFFNDCHAIVSNWEQA